MGLDITAYRKLSKVDNPALDADGDPTEETMDTCFCISPYTLEWSNNFGRAQADGLTAGVYDYEDTCGFRAGSYSGYGEWRRELAKLVGHMDIKELWEKLSPGPFIELINFADNEGVIGPIASAKLAKDFADFKDRAEKHPDADAPWFFELYCEWQKAFEMAADGGAVDFH